MTRTLAPVRPDKNLLARSLAAGGSVALGVMAAPSVAEAQVLPTTPVVLSGQPAPSTGAQYSRFGAASINPAGQVAFHAWLSGAGVTDSNDSAAFVTAPLAGGPRLLAREGQSARVGEPGVTLGELLLAGGPLTPDGETLVYGELKAGAARRGYAYFAGTLDDFRFVYRPAANEIIHGQPVLNAGPRAVLWRQGQNLIHWDGTNAAAVPTPGEIFQPTINGAGRIAFTAYSSDEGPSPGLYAGPPGDFRPVAVYGGAAPGLPAGHRFEVILNASQNNSGQLAFLASARADDPESYGWGLWAGRPDDLRLLARDGQPAPGLPDGYRFDRILWDIDSPTTPPLGAAGHVPFWATYKDASGSEERTGVWLARPGEPTRLIARSGDSVPVSLPGGPDEVSLANFHHNHQWVNGAGRVVLLVDTTEFTGQREALLAWDADGGLAMVALEGSPFEVAPGDFRNVGDILVGFGEGTGGEDGRTAAFNDAGQLVYRLTFADGTSGIFLTTVPEPGAAATLFIGLAELLRRRRRRRGVS